MTASTTQDPTQPRSYTHREVLSVMTGLLAALFTALISTTIVSTALPTIMADLNGTQRQYTWVITASLLAMTISTPIWGKLSDLFDKKMLTQLSITLFVVGSVAAGFATSISVLMTARALQGLAMGGLIALVQSIMGTILAPRERGRYAGYMGAVMAVATVSGPLLGGVITDGLGWRWCFFVSVPLAVIALVLLQRKLQLPDLARKGVKIDYLGGVLLSISAALPMLWVTFAGSDYDWISWQSGAFLVAFLVTSALTVRVELRVPEPMLPLHVLRNNTAALMIVASIAVGVAMFGTGVFLTQYFQLGVGNSPTRAGMMTIPMIITQMLSATIGGLIVTHTGRWKPVMLVGSFAMLIGLVGLGTIDSDTPYIFVAISMAVLGLGLGTLVQNIVLAVQNTVDVTEVGAASAAIAFFRSLGGAIGVSVLGAILTTQVSKNLSTGLRDLGVPAEELSDGSGEVALDISGLPDPVREVFHQAYADAFGPIFMIAAVMSIVTIVAIIVVHEVPLRTTVGMEPSDRQEDPSLATAEAAEPATAEGQSDDHRSEPSTTPKQW